MDSQKTGKRCISLFNARTGCRGFVNLQRVYFMRMDVDSFNHLVEMLEPLIVKQDTVMRESNKAKERVAITLRYLATGESFRSLAFLFRVSRQVISPIVEEVCDAIFEVIGSQHLKTPQKEEEWLRISSAFNQRWNFPNCLGAIDGKHIVIIQPGCTGSHYRNYKGSDSVVLLAVVGPNYEFLYVDVGANGRMSDGGIWNRSSLKASLSSQDNPLQIPQPRVLPSRTTTTPFVIVGDDAFSLTEYLMKPFPQTQLFNDENCIFNYRLSRCRRISENGFGILATRWRIFLKRIKLSPEKTTKIVLASTSLHNWLRRVSASEEMFTVPTPSPTNSEPSPTAASQTWFPFHAQGSNNHSNKVRQIREEFKDYFSNEGAVSWQKHMCGLE